MKTKSTAILICALAILGSPSAFAQWDYGQDSTWNMIEHRAEMRRMRARMKAREKGSRATSKKSATRRKVVTARKISVAPTRPAPPTFPRYGVEIRSDSYQEEFQYGDDGINKFKAHFTFTPVGSGKKILISGYCKMYDMDSALEGIPAGSYLVRAEVAHKGTKYRAHLGSKEGSSENPTGGDFAPSVKVVFKPIIDEGGSRVMGVYPPKIYVRVLKDSGVKWNSR